MPGLNPNKTVIRFERRKEQTAEVERKVPVQQSNNGSGGSSNSSGSSGN